LGALVRATGLQLPVTLNTLIKMLGDAAMPVALFAIGGVLWRARRHTHTRTPASSYLPVAAIKVFIHPVLVYALGVVAQRLGAALSNLELAALTLVAALPSASNVSLLAERVGADNGRIAHVILASTIVAFVSFSFAAFLLL
jgi:predicted permease